MSPDDYEKVYSDPKFGFTTAKSLNIWMKVYIRGRYKWWRRDGLLEQGITMYFLKNGVAGVDPWAIVGDKNGPFATYVN